MSNGAESFSLKSAATAFLNLVVSGKIREAYATHVRQDMRHHNPSFAGDAASLQKAMEENHASLPHKVLDVRHVAEEGNFVFVHSRIQLSPGGPEIAAVHIFRFEDGRIAELWDVGQPVPADSPNKNGMF